MHTTTSPMSSSTQANARDQQLEVRSPTAMDLPIDTMPFRDAVRYGFGVAWAERRYARDVIGARLAAKLEAETNRLALVTIASKALDQTLVTKFINELWHKLTGTLGESVAATEAEMRTHIKTVVGDAYNAIKGHNEAHEKGELPPEWRDRLVAREEARTDRIITKLDSVLDQLIETRVRLMTEGISLPAFAAARK